MVWKIRHLIYALIVLCTMAGATSKSGGVQRATDAMSDILGASFLAEHCGLYVQRLGGRSHHSLVKDGVVIQINERNVTMTDFVQLTTLYSPEVMIRFRNQALQRHGADPGNRQQMCFLARSMAGSSRGPGRFLERK